MKRYVPLKYALGMIMLFFIVPIISTILLLCLVGVNDWTIAISMFLGAVVIVGPIVYFKNRDNASIVIEDNQIINHMNDGTLNVGWSEEIRNIKKVEIVGKKEVQKYYKDCKSKKVLLIDFGSYNVKYIPVSLFTNKQINLIIKDLQIIMDKAPLQQN